MAGSWAGHDDWCAGLNGYRNLGGGSLDSEHDLAAVSIFARRFAGLDDVSRTLLLTLTVFGEATVTDFAVAAARSPEDTDALLQALVETHWLIRHGAHFLLARPDEHEQIRARASPETLRALHQRMAEQLILRNAAPELIAPHVVAVDPQGEGVRWSLFAAASLGRQRAFAQASAQAQVVLDHAAQAHDRSAAHRLLADFSAAQGEARTALRHLGFARRGATSAEVRAGRARAARLCLVLGKPRPAEKLARAILVEDAACPEAVMALADALFLRGAYSAVETLAARVDLADALPLEVEIALRNARGKVNLTRGALAKAEADFTQTAALAATSGNRREHARALINLGAVAQKRGDRAAALTHYREALDAADVELTPIALANIAAVCHEAGEIAESLEAYQRALAAFTRAGRAKEFAHAALNAARIYRWLGDAVRAGELVDSAAAAAAQIGDPYLQASVVLVDAEVCDERGEVERARAGYAEAIAEMAAVGCERYVAEAALVAAELESAQGAGEAARALCERARASGADAGPLRLKFHLALGEAALTAPADLKLAEQTLERARELSISEPDLESPTRVYHLLGRLELLCGKTGAAEAHWTRAARLLDEVATRVPQRLREGFLAARARRRVILEAAGLRELTPSLHAAALRLPSAASTDSGVVGAAPALRRVLELATRLARGTSPVLLRGESGTGKELVAERIHADSPRRASPFVRVNCGALSDELLLSELFGHEKGAFTGALREHRGRFELADGGTLFLDEVADVSAKAQVALLRVLQSGEFERLGGGRTLKVDVRVVCATNRPLEKLIAEGKFREDLYYRLKGAMLTLPPLRDRGNDVLTLATHFLARAADRLGEPVRPLSSLAAELLRRYAWPGNVRELENVLDSAVLLASGAQIDVEAFEVHPELLAESTRAPLEMPAPPAPFEVVADRGLSLKELRQEVEIGAIRGALSTARGNISEAARLLKMKRSRLSQIVNAEPVLRAIAKGA